MTLQKDQDPGWWRRGMTKRAQVVVVVVAVAILAGVGIAIAVSGIPLF
jgi:hypothetical protein